MTLGHDMDLAWPAAEARFEGGVIMTPAVRYGVPDNCRPLTLDLYRPDPATKPASGFPLIIFIHGGSWARGDSRASRPLRRFPWLLAAIAARGYVVASIDYRLVGEALWPAQGQDVKTAIRFLRKNAARLDADPNRIATWGCSCGGHLSGIAAATAGVASLASRDAALEGVDDSVQAAVAWYGGFNMDSITDQSQRVPGCFDRSDRRMPEWNLLGGFAHELDPEFVRSAGPVNFVHAAMPPMLIVTGDRDVLIPYHQSVEMAERMRAVGAEVTLEVIAGVGHDFAGEGYAQTLAANQHALDMTIAFLDRALREPPLRDRQDQGSVSAVMSVEDPPPHG